MNEKQLPYWPLTAFGVPVVAVKYNSVDHVGVARISGAVTEALHAGAPRNICGCCCMSGGEKNGDGGDCQVGTSRHCTDVVFVKREDFAAFRLTGQFPQYFVPDGPGYSTPATADLTVVPLLDYPTD